jgi:hypothetical protein
MHAPVPVQECPVSDPTSDLTFRPSDVERRRRRDDAWEAAVREELNELRHRPADDRRVVPASRDSAEPEAPDESPQRAAGARARR